MKRGILYKAIIPTEIGEVLACSTDDGICLIEFSDREGIEHELRQLADELGLEVPISENHHIKKLKNELGHYFDGSLSRFTVPVHLIGTSFQKRVWQELMKIPFGQTRTYAEQARAIGDIKAIRAVAGTNAANRINIVVPCHRVIGSDGRLTGYRGGIHRKRFLLTHEREHSNPQGMNLELFDLSV